MTPGLALDDSLHHRIMNHSSHNSATSSHISNSHLNAAEESYDYDDEIALQVTPSTLQVDFDKNLTELYQAITEQNWNLAADVCATDVIQAKTWVVRHYQQQPETDDDEDDPEIMWRFLPLHSACARQPPTAVVAALLRAYPDAAKCMDDQGMYALHYAAGNQAAPEAMKLLIDACPLAAKKKDPRGMLPMHYLACWGPSDPSVIDMLLDVSPDHVENIRDGDGNTPLDLATQGEYPEKPIVIQSLRRASSSLARKAKQKLQTMRQHRRTQSNGSAYHDAIVVGENNNNTPTIPKSSSHGSVTTGRKQPLEPTGSTKTSVSSKKSASSTPPTRSSLTPTPPPTLESRQVPSSSERSVGGGSSTSKLSYASQQQRQQRQNASPSRPSRRYSPPAVTTVSRDSADGSSIHSQQQLQTKYREQEQELARLQEQMSSTRKALGEKTEKLTGLEYELSRTQNSLSKSQSECKGLRETLSNVMEENNRLKKKHGNTFDRLATLSISLESMMEQQAVLTQVVKQRHEAYQHTTRQRQELFHQLQLMDQTTKDEESRLNASLQKQTREMQAIAAVISAARD